MSATDFPFAGGSRKRYTYQWVTTCLDDGNLLVTSYCIRDMDKFDNNIVFEHESEEVCKKLMNILNEGA